MFMNEILDKFTELVYEIFLTKRSEGDFKILKKRTRLIYPKCHDTKHMTLDI